MTYTVSGANFNKDVAAQGTSINYKENKTVKSEGKTQYFFTKLYYKSSNKTCCMWF